MDKPSRTIIVVALLVAAALLATLASGCGGGATVTTEPTTPTTSKTPTSPTAPTTTGAATQNQKAFTTAELAQYNGKNGQPAYVAVDGVVYDVSGSALWAGGVHSRCPQGAAAGRDLSDVINEAPANMRARLEQFPVVGTLAQ